MVRLRLILIPSAVALLLGGAVRGHVDSAEYVATLTTQIEKGDKSAPTYYARGVELRTLGKLEASEADLREAVRLDPNFLPGRKDLTRTLVAGKKLPEAAAAAKEALEVAKARTTLQQASCWMLMAEVERAREDFRAMLEATTQALRLAPRGEVDWFLTRAEARRKLGQEEAGVADLKAGFESTHSSVLRDAWLDALVAAGRGQEALATIEKELAECRHKASWLIRRAAVRQAMKDAAGAASDLKAAIKELNELILPEEPDLTMVVDRGVAEMMAGNRAAAMKDLEWARKENAEPELLVPLEKILGVPPLPPAPPPAPVPVK